MLHIMCCYIAQVRCKSNGTQVQGVTKFVANRNLPVALKEDISRHLEGSQVIRNEQGEGDVFSRLSHTLQVGTLMFTSSTQAILANCLMTFMTSDANTRARHHMMTDLLWIAKHYFGIMV